MRKYRPFVLFCCLGLLLAGCSAQAQTVEEVVTMPAPSISTEAPTATAVVTEVVVEAPVDNCLTCHSDQQTLIDTALVVEAGEGESKGVG